MYTLPVGRLKTILSQIITDATLLSFEQSETTQLARLYTLIMSDGRELTLSLAPSLRVPLLRHEAASLQSEAALALFLKSSTSLSTGRTLPEDEARPSSSNQQSELFPTLLKHVADNKELGYPYSIFEPTAGVPLSTISLYLSIPERLIIDNKIGSLARSLASLSSPTNLFGPANRILPDSPNYSPSSPEPPGTTTWSETFNILLESVLRDGEDMAVILPYDAIRAQFTRLSPFFDAVKTPRLVILNLGDETNIMVQRNPDSTEVTGLRSWSQGIFGDAVMATCWDSSSSEEEFIRAWKAGGQEIVEGEESTEERKLLYICYRALVGILVEYYRPQRDSSRRELEARRTLTSALAVLERGDRAGRGEGGAEDGKVKRSLERDVGMGEGARRQRLR